MDVEMHVCGGILCCGNAFYLEKGYQNLLLCLEYLGSGDVLGTKHADTLRITTKIQPYQIPILIYISPQLVSLSRRTLSMPSEIGKPPVKLSLPLVSPLTSDPP